MPRLLITFAHPLEAAPTLSALSTDQIAHNHLYEFDRGLILITGLGPIAAAAQTATHATGCDQILNFGLAGALQDNIPVGELREVSIVSKHLSFPPNLHHHSLHLSETSHPELHLSPTGWRLITSAYPIWDSHLKTHLSEHHDIVDMEGYGIATAATALNLPCHQYKIISDHAIDQGWDALKSRITRLSENLAEHALAILQ